MRFFAGVLIGAVLVFTLPACFNDVFEPAWPEPGTVVAMASSPDRAAEAVLISNFERGHYHFEIRDSGSGDVLARTAISAPLGYHEHAVSIYWADTRRAEMIIDHDFGDNNLRFNLSY
jgi:hypothetical protein